MVSALSSTRLWCCTYSAIARWVSSLASYLRGRRPNQTSGTHYFGSESAQEAGGTSLVVSEGDPSCYSIKAPEVLIPVKLPSLGDSRFFLGPKTPVHSFNRSDGLVRMDSERILSKVFLKTRSIRCKLTLFGGTSVVEGALRHCRPLRSFLKHFIILKFMDTSPAPTHTLDSDYLTFPLS
jgi:hypothetical protein